MVLIAQSRDCVKVHLNSTRMNYCSAIERQILPKCIPSGETSCFPADSRKRLDFEADLAWLFLWRAKINVSRLADRAECDRFFVSRGITNVTARDYDKFYPIDTGRDDKSVNWRLNQLREKKRNMEIVWSALALY